MENLSTLKATVLASFMGKELLTIVAALLILLALLLLRNVKEAFRSDLRGLPGPKWAAYTKLYRVFGLWTGQAPTFYLKLHDQFGTMVRTGPNSVSISDPRAVAKIYGISSTYLKSRFYETMSPFYQGEVMESMFTTRDPAQHRSLKRPVAAKFSMTTIKTFEPLTDDCSKIFMDSMMKHEGEVVNFGVWLQWYAFDVIGSITFNRRFGFMEKERDINYLIEDIEAVLPYASIVGQVPELHPWLVGNRTLMETMKKVAPFHLPDPLGTIVDITQECIDDYDKSPNSEDQAPDFLTMLRTEAKQNNEHIPPRDLMNHLSNNLLAGSDTTAIALRTVFYYSMRNPRIYQRLQHEIDEADRDGKLSEYVTFAESLELEYLQAVFKEALRYHPSVSYPLERLVPPGGDEICGVKMNAGTIVGVNPIVLHFNKEVFGEDAAEFRPERWLDSSPDQLQAMNKNLLTFGVGSRTCLGKNISIMEMGKVVPQILRHFDITWASDKPEWKVMTYWFSRQIGFFARLQPRQNKPKSV